MTNDLQHLDFVALEVTISHDGLKVLEPFDQQLDQQHQTTSKKRKASNHDQSKINQALCETLAELQIYKPPYEEPPELFTRTLVKEPKVQYYPRSVLISLSGKLTQVGTYRPGDLVWAQSQGWSYWPAMIVADPVVKEGKGLEYVHTNKYNQPHHYFVQFFGFQLYTAWTLTSRIKPYNGWKAYQRDLFQELDGIRTSGQKLARVEQEVIREKEDLRNWRLAIAEADEAVRLSNEQRIELLSYEYVEYED